MKFSAVIACIALSHQVSALYFDCFFNKLTKEHCETSEYCVWAPQASTCSLSAESEYLVCLYDKADSKTEAECRQDAAKYCTLTTNQEHCTLQASCTWKDDVCVSKSFAPIYAADGNETASPTQSPFKLPNQTKRRQCCNESKKVCLTTSRFYKNNKDKHHNKFTNQVQLSKSYCGLPSTSTISELCGPIRDKMLCARV